MGCCMTCPCLKPHCMDVNRLSLSEQQAERFMENPNNLHETSNIAAIGV